MSNTLSPWFSLDTTLFITSGLPTLGPHSSAEHCEIANRKTDTEIRNKNERFNSLRWLQIPCAIATDGRPCFPIRSDAARKSDARSFSSFGGKAEKFETSMLTNISLQQQV